MGIVKAASSGSVGKYRAADHKHQSQAQKDPQNMPLIKVNGHVIDEKALAEEVQYHPAGDFALAVQKAGQALVIQHLLKAQLTESELQDKGEEQALAELIQRNIIESAITDEDSLRYYEQNKEKFETAPLMEVSHILLLAGPKDTGLRVKQRYLAEKLLRQLQENLDLFSSFVEEYSDCPSKKIAGSLGQLSKGQTVLEFERQVFPLPEGLHNRAIESRYGYHIVFVNKKIEGKQLEFSMVENKINNYLVHRRHRQAVSDYLYKLADKASIEGIKLQLEQDNIVIGQ